MPQKAKKQYLKKYKKEAKKEARHSPEDEKTEKDGWQLKSETKNGIVVVVVFVVAILSIFSLFGGAGSMGKAVDTGLEYLFGWGKYLFPVLLLVFGYFLSRPQKYELRLSTYVGFILLIVSVVAFLHLAAVPFERATADIQQGRGGGYVGLLLYYPLQKLMGPWASGVVIVAIAIVSLLILFDIPLKRLSGGVSIFRKIAERFREFFYKLKVNMSQDTETETTEDDEEPSSSFDVKEVSQEATANNLDQEGDATAQKPDYRSGQQQTLPVLKKKKSAKVDLPIDLLESSNKKPTSGDIEDGKKRIQKTLENFGIEVEMGETKVGPTVTQYTLKPAEGVKLSQITTLGNDLALALAAHPIRIEAPIPGKSLVGIEVPNQAVAVVKLKELLTSSEFKKRKSPLTVALGKDVAGATWLADLDPMPHLLVAGATGSGKSVCLNSILISLLYQNTPEQLKLILVDPKRVELSVYNDIPHLLTPVVNEIDKTINALRWVVSEMDRRYELLSKSGHRDIHTYNRDNGNTMPFLVLAIDELADLMSVAANEVEAAIIRLAQMARAVGIHLVLATQRPSVDIITGLIKANITTRIAFSVASTVDSRTILDSSGAEKLLGRGDLLYISPQVSKPKRLQGAYVTDQEITRVVGHLKNQANPEYQEAVTAKVIDKTLERDFEDLADDELLGQAKELVIKAGKASASFLQRRLRIGYARAARLLDILEEQGIIGPGDGAKPREILVDRSQAPNQGMDAADGTNEGNEEITEEDEEDREYY